MTGRPKDERRPLSPSPAMRIRPWDAALDSEEWRRWLADGRDFGQLAVNNPGQAPVVVPAHFLIDGESILLHLARQNPVWPMIDADPAVLLSVLDDYAFVPTTWRAKPDQPAESGVPTSYYATVQFACQATVIDEPEEKAELLRKQLAHFQPDGDHALVAVGQPPYGGMLAGIRGLHLEIHAVTAKFKYDDNKPGALRAATAARLEARMRRHDPGAAAQQRRRLELIGEWRDSEGGQ